MIYFKRFTDLFEVNLTISLKYIQLTCLAISLKYIRVYPSHFQFQLLQKVTQKSALQIPPFFTSKEYFTPVSVSSPAVATRAMPVRRENGILECHLKGNLILKTRPLMTWFSRYWFSRYELKKCIITLVELCRDHKQALDQLGTHSACS